MDRIRRISIRLNDRSFEYDIYTLVIAFFQGIRTSVFDPEKEIPEDSDLLVSVLLNREADSLSADRVMIGITECREGGASQERTVVCPDGCVIFKLTATPLGNENFHTGGFWEYPDQT